MEIRSLHCSYLHISPPHPPPGELSMGHEQKHIWNIELWAQHGTAVPATKDEDLGFQGITDVTLLKPMAPGSSPPRKRVERSVFPGQPVRFHRRTWGCEVIRERKCPWLTCPFSWCFSLLPHPPLRSQAHQPPPLSRSKPIISSSLWREPNLSQSRREIRFERTGAGVEREGFRWAVGFVFKW